MDSLSGLVLILFLSIFFRPAHEQTFDTYDYDAYGQRLAMNEYFAVLASNDYGEFNVFFAPYSSNSYTYSIPYQFLDEYVYSVAIGSKQNGSQLHFSFIGEYLNSSTSSPSMRPYFGYYSISTCGGPAPSSYRWDLNQAHQETFVLGVDPYGLVAYAITAKFVMRVFLDTATQFTTTFSTSIYSNFAPRAIVVDQNQTAHIAGYLCSGALTCQIMFMRMWGVTLSYLFWDDTMIVSTPLLPLGSLFTSYARASDISLSINYDLQQLLLGVPYLATVFVYNYLSGFPGSTHNYGYVANFTYSPLGVGFGKSVAWLDNNTIAILAYSLATLPWSTSQVQIHHLGNLFLTNGSVPQPYSVYPNSQQVLIGTPTNPLPTALLSLVSWSPNSLAVLTDARDVWLIPASPPGFSSSQPLTVSSLPDVKIYESQACIPGTEKKESTCGYCFVCPTNTKNNGSFGIQCQTCSKDSFCPLGSTNDILDESTTSYDQADPYPESPESTLFDDILLSTMFGFGSTTHCLLISPLFWVCIVLGLASIIIITMAILAFFPKRRKSRQAIKQFFLRMDLVGEGELWIGGLMSLAIAVLVAFACSFSSSYVQLYPIENVTDGESPFTCDPTSRNAKFTSGLQLLSITKLEDEKPIFEMLDSQPFTLTVEFVNTGFTCGNVSMQENTGSASPSILWTSFDYSIQSKNATLVVSTLLPAHQTIMQYNLTGPYFIGGIRICLASSASSNNPYTLRQLDFCQFFSTINQTLASSPYVSVEMTKVINRTAAFSSNDPIRYTGLWLPALTIQPLSDQLLYYRQGDYLRYLIYQTVLVVDISETSFYVKNTQEPIARETEIIFHTVLFTIVCLELFGLLFLIIKLTIAPLILSVQNRLLKTNNKVGILPFEIGQD